MSSRSRSSTKRRYPKNDAPPMTRRAPIQIVAYFASTCAALGVLVVLVALVTSCLTSARTYIDCASDQMLCGGGCADILTDPNNCGGCGNPDSPADADGGSTTNICSLDGGGGCVNGSCGVICSGGRIGCGSLCVDITSDPNNCGACGNACTGVGYCVDGGCQISCPSPLTACPAGYPMAGGGSTDASIDGATDASEGSFDGGTLTVDASAGAVEAGVLIQPVIIGPAAISLCSNLYNDDLNCGGCGYQCAPGYRCTAGVCSPSCTGGALPCAQGCTDTLFDNLNCGTCGNICNIVSQACSYGICCVTTLTGCPSGSSVACVDTTTDRNNCGGCGVSCYLFPQNMCISGFCH